jgi:hypothetical protein
MKNTILSAIVLSSLLIGFSAEAGLFKKKKPLVETPTSPAVVAPAEPIVSAPVASLPEDEKKNKKPDEPKKVRPKIYNYNYWLPTFIEDYMKLVVASPVSVATPAGGPTQCLPVFKNPLKNGVIDIRYALGYFDDSQAIDIMYDDFNYGLSPSLDIEVFHVIRGALTKKCEGNRVLCSFKESGDPSQGLVVLEKKINLQGAEVLARITLTHASASESFEDNKNLLKDRQDFLTKQSEENYFGAIGKADIVIYNGHSRNGGGPDFNPPILSKDLHVNYDGYYKVKRPGINRVLTMLKQNPNKDSVMGFFSCYSKSHFYNALLRANPKQKLILSSDTINYFDSLYASMGYLEGLLHGQCGQDLADMAKQADSVKEGFTSFQIK